MENLTLYRKKRKIDIVELLGGERVIVKKNPPLINTSQGVVRLICENTKLGK